MGISEIVFFIVAALAIASSLGVILHPHPVYSALSLVLALFQIAVLFILLDAQMVAFLQIIVYAGAIMVLFLFVIMLLNVGREQAVATPSWRALMAVVGGVLAFEFAWFFLRRASPPSGSGRLEEGYGSVAALARTLFTDHVLSFELTSILLLVAIVGAVVLGKRHGAE